jgi:hypothetical protein
MGLVLHAKKQSSQKAPAGKTLSGIFGPAVKDQALKLKM